MDQVWEELLDGEEEETYSSHSSEEENIRNSYANQYVCKPDASWEQIVHCLYGHREITAAKKAKTFLQQKGVWLIV